MDPRLVGVIRRYLGYGWSSGRIVSLLRFQFDAPVRSQCVENLRRDRPCAAKCAEDCPVRESSRWFTPRFEEE